MGANMLNQELKTGCGSAWFFWVSIFRIIIFLEFILFIELCVIQNVKGRDRGHPTGHLATEKLICPYFTGRQQTISEIQFLIQETYRGKMEIKKFQKILYLGRE